MSLSSATFQLKWLANASSSEEDPSTGTVELTDQAGLAIDEYLRLTGRKSDQALSLDVAMVRAASPSGIRRGSDGVLLSRQATRCDTQTRRTK